ncbi:MAG: pyridoxamine 5'-phosphate oxidase [Microgenomates group bacterium GW2011_GWA1_48_10]|uniref:Pyridoxamine 5'-phosphate oxidase N-terminal domain-containing protein n=1 Tax=Candidatus Gottesmanbacteria bacterium RIFCSPHIGHO2_01_FULL_47_48 TaxID=1798381 RepID=A0A1F6A603_9BACT|nr:MAG: pyridoxamine 5'-phosphate oxidase [Microgenomates group bacterium GW2011_GWA1_48_10]OGG19717.1 MAG: hypothetical protein A2721_01015 [Candidatus Gottesmanbacteria bacterium RIFCSPHIGHO2_01_FULL_47_48]
MALNKSEITKLLSKEQLVYIATVKQNGNPHIAPIWFVYHQGKIYFETDKTTVKFGNIKRHNRIALCFSGKPGYIIEGSVEWWVEKEAPVPFRKLLWEKYGKDMDDSYITEKTYIFEVIPEKEMSWHYAPGWD